MTDKRLSVDFEAITSIERETWAMGDFHRIARQNVCVAEVHGEAVEPHAGERVLDIACGSGTAALVAARRVCFDVVPRYDVLIPIDKDSDFRIFGSVKTTVDIPEKELQDAIKFSGARTKKEAIQAALADYNRRQRMAALVKHAGSSETMATNQEIEALDLKRRKHIAGK